jgi:hypothetical protein
MELSYKKHDNEKLFDTLEKSYNEKVSGNSKDIEIEWESIKKVSDYFKYEIKTKFRILGMTDVEVKEENKTVI